MSVEIERETKKTEATEAPTEHATLVARVDELEATIATTREAADAAEAEAAALEQERDRLPPVRSFLTSLFSYFGSSPVSAEPPDGLDALAPPVDSTGTVVVGVLVCFALLVVAGLMGAYL